MKTYNDKTYRKMNEEENEELEVVPQGIYTKENTSECIEGTLHPTCIVVNT